jgi:hypothetical protein
MSTFFQAALAMRGLKMGYGPHWLGCQRVLTLEGRKNGVWLVAYGIK